MILDCYILRLHQPVILLSFLVEIQPNKLLWSFLVLFISFIFSETKKLKTVAIFIFIYPPYLFFCISSFF